MSGPARPGCRFCGRLVDRTVADLGMQPLSNAFVPAEGRTRMEPFYPLRALVCESCFLVQIEEWESPETIFAADYPYYSSYSDSWLRHAREYVDTIAARLALGPESYVVEVASNDGYLLRNFLGRAMQVLGIEPAGNVADAAEAIGVPTLRRFFGADLARELSADRRADLIIGNNVLAHVPDLNDFVEGLRILLAPSGTITLEFPHLLRLLEGNQFDTIYHEHFSYFSLTTATRVFAAHRLQVYDVEEVPTHGGSLRVYVRHEDGQQPGAAVAELVDREERFGITRPETYDAFNERVQAVKRSLLSFLIAARNEGRRVVGYGAAAKGNTLLNYCGIRTDLLEFVVDRNPHKQGRLLPGTRIPVYAPERVDEARPDYLLILPWNLRQEVEQQMAHVRGWECRFVVPIPAVEVSD